MACKMLARSLLWQPNGFCSTWSVSAWWNICSTDSFAFCSWMAGNTFTLFFWQLFIWWNYWITLSSHRGILYCASPTFLYVETSVGPLDIPQSSAQLWDRWIVCAVSMTDWMGTGGCSAFSDGVVWPSFPTTPELGRSVACEAGSNIG